MTGCSSIPTDMGLLHQRRERRLSAGTTLHELPYTTSANERINMRFHNIRFKGAGFGKYEYADTNTLGTTRTQLEAIFWARSRCS